MNNGPEDLDQNFTYEINIFGNRETRELKLGGSQILVTQENKKEYIELLCHAKMTLEIKPQIQALIEGFRMILPLNIIKIFSPSEFEMLLSGAKEIDIALLKNKTVYSGAKVTDHIIIWFWEIVEEFDQNARTCLLYFATGIDYFIRIILFLQIRIRKTIMPRIRGLCFKT